MACFEERWNLPNVCDAIDSKHIHMQKPPNSSSLYYNYKGTFSIVLLAVIDGDYRFMLVDIGEYGSNSDGGVFAQSRFGHKFAANKLNMPLGRILPGFPAAGLPYVLVGDEAFPLKPNLMKPFPGANAQVLCDEESIFNYRLSRGRHIMENAFGILTERWYVLKNTMQCLPDNCIKIVQAALVLHYYLTVPGKSAEVVLARLNSTHDQSINAHRHGIRFARNKRE